jgi:DNA repair protein SbcD/Mre11
MLKLLHFADIHIGMENYGRTDPNTGLSSRVNDFLERLDDMVEYAQTHNADLAIFAGDAFKNRNPNPTFQREFAWRVLDLAQHCPVVLLVGNHDLPINSRKASSVEIYETLNVPNVFVGRNYELLEVETNAGLAVIGTAPYPIRQRLLEDDDLSGGRRTIADIDALMQQKLELILRDLALQASKYDAPRILTGHFSVHGALHGSERQVMLGRDVATTLANLADPTWDYIAMGHIHKFQDMTADRDDLPPIVYSGSMERIDFGEEADDKGFVWAEIERGTTRYEFVKLPARSFLTLRLDITSKTRPTEHVLAAIDRHHVRGAVVRVIIKADLEANALLNVGEIERTLREKGVSAIAAIQRQVEQPDRVRLGDTPEGLSPLELLDRYLDSRDVSAERKQRLLDAAEELMTD